MGALFCFMAVIFRQNIIIIYYVLITGTLQGQSQDKITGGDI